MRVTFHPAAEIELYDAALYYESQRRGLGSTFLQAIETDGDGRNSRKPDGESTGPGRRSKQAGAAVPLFGHVLRREW